MAKIKQKDIFITKIKKKMYDLHCTKNKFRLEYNEIKKTLIKNNV